MWQFISGVNEPNAKKQKTDEEKREQQKTYDQNKRVRCFQTSWKSSYGWLEYVGNKMYCSPCKTFESTGSFVIGSTNFKLESVKAHDCSDGHKRCVLKERAKQASAGESTAEKSLLMLNKAVFNKLTYLFRNAHFIAKNGKPYTDYVLLCKLDEAKDIDIGKTYLTDKYCQKFVAAIAETRRQEQKELVDTSPFLAVISDGATDSACKEAEIIVVRISNACEVSTLFVGIKNVAKADAENISASIFKHLTDCFGDTWKTKIIAMGTDGASVMVGKKTGVVKRMRDLTNRPIHGIHCSAHRLELAYKDAVKGIKIYEKCEILLLNLYLFYKYSPLNRANLRTSCQSLGQPFLVPLRVGGTRWLPHTQRAIQNILSGYSAIVQHLEQMQNPSDVKKESSAKARNFLKLLKDKSVEYWLHLMMDIIKCLSKVSTTIQTNTSTLADVWLELESAKAILLKYTKSDGPYLRKITQKYADESWDHMQKRRTEVLQALIDSLNRRFEGDVEMFKACSFLSFDRWPVDLSDEIDFGDHDMEKLVRICEPLLESAECEVESIEPEWTQLKTNLSARKVKTRSLTWKSLYLAEGEKYRNLFMLINYLLTLPTSSADAERGFSNMKMVKNDWRSRLGETNLSDLMLVSLETPEVNEYNPERAIQTWYTGGVRAKRPFYKDELRKCQIPTERIIVDTNSNEVLDVDVNSDEEVELLEQIEITKDGADDADDLYEEDDDDDIERLQSAEDIRQLQIKSYQLLKDIL